MQKMKPLRHLHDDNSIGLELYFTLCMLKEAANTMLNDFSRPSVSRESLREFGNLTCVNYGTSIEELLTKELV